MIRRWSSGDADAHMDEGILVDLAGDVRRHPWWSARASLTVALLGRLGVRPPARVLDAGCGWGVTLAALERRVYRASGLDVSRRALAQLDRERAGRELIEADLTRPLPPDVDPFDAVLALDVIEHLDDDRSAVERLGRLARPSGGLVVVSVPAAPDLFSDFDRVQGHRRRYDPPRLRAAFAETGLVVEDIFWWGAWMVPVVRRQRARQRPLGSETPAEAYRRYLRVPPWPGPWLLRLAYALEQPRALARRLRSGTSLFAVARRP
jgi:SAM-dependent methyltransferase